MKAYLSRCWRVLLVLSIATGLLFGSARVTHANLAGSTFEGGDGNLTVDTAGNTDWANVAGLSGGIDLPSGTSDNSFGQGTKEDNSAVTVVSGSIPPNKSDLTRFYEASEAVGGQNFLYLAWERSNVLGSANMDFEINQATTANLGLPGAHVINRMAGDLLVTYDFTNGGSRPTLGLLTWITSGSVSQCFSNNALPCWGNQQTLNSGDSEGAINTTTVTDPIAPNAGRSLPALTFGEAAINLTAAGVFPAGTCEAFGSVFLKSRSSASFTAEVKDFVAPVPVNISNCGTITIHKVTENGDGTFGYTTTGGLTPSTFNLSNGGQQQYQAVAAGSYSVTESTLPSAWTLKSLVCGTVTGTGTSATPSGATVNITMAAGGTVDCTYTNHTNLSPTITTLLSQSTANVGDTVNDTAKLSGATANAGGTVTYTVYGDSACTLGAQSAGTVNVTNGIVPNSNGIQFNSAGTFGWKAVYSGDANNNGATSTCASEQLVVKTNPSISTLLSPASPVAIGTAVHDTATLSGATSDAGGTVTYTVYTDASCQTSLQSAGTKSVSNGTVPNSDPITFNNAGTFYWQAVYSGDAKNNGATSPCLSEQLVVNPNQPSIGTAQNLIPNDNATLSNATSGAGGSITFNLFSPSDASCAATPALTQTVSVSGNGTYKTTNTTFIADVAGTWKWQVSYTGDSNNQPATSACGVESFSINQ